MSEYIEKAAVLKALASEGITRNMRVFKKIQDIPTGEMEQVRQGRWLPYKTPDDTGLHYCSECKRQAFNYMDGEETVEILSEFCQKCGAKMDDGDD